MDARASGHRGCSRQQALPHRDSGEGVAGIETASEAVGLTAASESTAGVAVVAREASSSGVLASWSLASRPRR